jgi:hypothetical protein
MKDKSYLKASMEHARISRWPGTIEQRAIRIFWTYVQKTPTCWLWVGTKRLGYGSFGCDYKTIQAHRFSWEVHRGKIPDGFQIDHLCRNPSCVNPNHLEPVTQRENILRGIGATSKLAKQTHCKYGHPLSGDNLYAKKIGQCVQRNCRICKRAYFDAWKATHPDYWKKSKQEGDNACVQ